MDTETLSKVIERLTPLFQPYRWYEDLTPFEVLVRAIISQATERRGTRRAFAVLRKTIGVTPSRLMAAGETEIAECLKPAGLHRQKAVKLKAVATAIELDHSGDIRALVDLPLEEARRRLIDLPGVGPKTADVVLSFVAGRPVIPVDTHIARISKRWELVGPDARYEEIRAAIEAGVPPERRRTTHLTLIEFGREVCRARDPLCPTCPVLEFCPWGKRRLGML